MSDLKRGDRCVHLYGGHVGTVKERYEGSHDEIPQVGVEWDDGERSIELIYAVRSAGVCPECDLGVVVPDGPMDPDTGHRPFRCSHRCGWTS